MVKLHDQRFHNKQSLLYNILVDLEKKDSFAEFVLYLKSVEESLRTWIKAYTLEYCCTVAIGRKTRLEQLADEELSAKVALMKDAAIDATRSCPKTLGKWLTNFHKPLKSSFHLNLEEICQVLGVAETGFDEDKKTDFEYF